MKGLIELSNFVVKTISSKCIIPSKTEGEGEVKSQNVSEMCWNIWSNVFFSIMPLHDVNFIYSTVVKLEEAYLSFENQFKIY